MQSSFLRITLRPIFALTFYALPLVSVICASTAAAEPQSAELEQAEKTAVDHALSEENDALGRGDLSAFVQHFDVPFVRISSQGVKVLSTMSEIEAFYRGFLRDLRARGYSRSTRSGNCM